MPNKTRIVFLSGTLLLLVTNLILVIRRLNRKNEITAIQRPLPVDRNYNISTPLPVDRNHNISTPLPVDRNYNRSTPLPVDRNYNRSTPLPVDRNYNRSTPLPVDRNYNRSTPLPVDRNYNRSTPLPVDRNYNRSTPLPVDRNYNRSTPLPVDRNYNRSTPLPVHRNYNRSTPLPVDRNYNRSNRITARESHHISYKLDGRIFSQKTVDKSYEITTCVLHSFVDHVGHDVAKMFLSEPTDKTELKTAAIGSIWHRGELLVVIRVWLNQGLAEKKKNAYKFQDSFFFMQKYNSDFTPITRGKLLGIPAPITQQQFSGPEDPRLIQVGDTVYVVFSMVLNKFYLTGFFVWDFIERKLFRPTIKNFKLRSSEKNWSPIVLNGTLHFVYTLFPLRVVKCNKFLRCEFIFQDTGNYAADHAALRGGTPFEKYRGNYYVSMAHTSISGSQGRELNAHLVLLRIDQWHIVYVSDVFKIDQAILKTTGHPFWTSRTFLYPTGIIVENDDVIDVAVNIGDTRCYMIRVSGLKALFDNVIELSAGDNRDSVNSTSIQDYLLKKIQIDIKEKKEIYSKD
ncbi:uncharacterized protein LOC135503084 isoform X1 [Lineus longissimus]|uniref:uncharacterized protein LOC135503084 isoform X1 n=1 Tax=Lineus longissimus TaxID=88925 RepID=UPI002B4D5946